MARNRYDIVKANTGRPLFDGKNVDDVIQKLEQVWAIGGSDAEAASYAEISCAALSDFLHKHPKLSERKQRLKERPILQARQEVVKGIKGDKLFAFQYLKAKRSKEFTEEHKLNVDIRSIHLDVVKIIQEAEKQSLKEQSKD